ncbi:MAG: 2-keto-4-pentenoate hydratase [Pseudomonadota bacterium]
MASRAVAAARFLAAEHRARRRFRPLPRGLRPQGIAEAYAAQDRLHALLIPERGEIAGYKVALTSAAIRKMCGHDQPCAGAIFASTVRAAPAALEAEDYVHLGIECEIALRLGADLEADGAPYDRERVAGSVEAAMAAFELVEDRQADYAAFDLVSLIADNCWNAGIVLGPAQRDWRRLDLAALRGRLSINGRPAGEGHGGDAMGHPLAVLAWLANDLGARAKPLRAGMVVMTGSLIATQFLRAGDEARFSLDGLGEASLGVA